MANPIQVYRSIKDIDEGVSDLVSKIGKDKPAIRPSGIAGFDGFIDTFVRMQSPSTMAEFGPKVAAAAGIAASYPVHHLGDKFGGNGPLLASAMHGIFNGDIDLTYIGAMGDKEVLPIYQDAIGDKTSQLFSLAEPAHSDCLEFDDGKVMLGDLRACADVTWDRLVERVGNDTLNTLLRNSSFIGAVNWGKLVNVGDIWKNLALRLGELGVEPKKVPFFMDLAEFEQRPKADVDGLLQLLPKITKQCHSILSFNLKEAWQMGAFFAGDFAGKKDPDSVAQLAHFLRERIEVDRIVIHPNDGAACASALGTIYVPGPMCQKPLISTGAGDNFGAGCLSAAVLGLDDLSLLLCGVASSGWFVRSGESPTLKQICELLELWKAGSLPERL